MVCRVSTLRSSRNLVFNGWHKSGHGLYKVSVPHVRGSQGTIEEHLSACDQQIVRISGYSRLRRNAIVYQLQTLIIREPTVQRK